MPGRDIAAEGVDQVVEDFRRDVVLEQRGFQRRIEAPRPRQKHVALDRGGVVAGERVLDRQMPVGVALPGGAAQVAVGAGAQRVVCCPG